MKRNRNKQILGYCFILPAVIYMIALIGYPIVYNWIISFQDATALTLKDSNRAFVGLANFRAIFADKTFWGAMAHTFIYTIGCLVIQFALGCPVLCKKIQFFKTDPRLYRHQLDAAGYGYRAGI